MLLGHTHAEAVTSAAEGTGLQLFFSADSKKGNMHHGLPRAVQASLNILQLGQFMPKLINE